jgi:hypothetical protein
VRINQASLELAKVQQEQANQQVASGALAPASALPYATRVAELEESLLGARTEVTRRELLLAQLLGEPGGLADTPGTLGASESPAGPSADEPALGPAPDGTRIAFQRGTGTLPGDSIGIFTVAANAGGVVPPSLLTFQGAQEANPDWQPVAGPAQQEPGAAAPQGAARAAKRCFGRTATIVGTNRRDVLRGTPGPDVIHGLRGRDVIKGLRGNDRLCGGRGRDRIFGGKGRDILIGGDHADFLSGGAGDDRLFGGTPGAPIRKNIDTCRGGEGTDRFRNCQRRG